MWYVYALIEKLTQEIRYIGCSKAPKARLRAHRCYKNRPVGGWLATGVQVEIAIVGEFDDLNQALECEQRCMFRAKRIGFNLLNKQAVHVVKNYSSGRTFDNQSVR